MRWWSQLLMRIRMTVGRSKATSDLDRELAFHVERQTEENLRAGMTAQQARTAALRAFGNPALLRDEAHSTWSWSAIESILRDLRIACRGLLRTPGFTITAIGVIALGIGANVALFTVVRGVLLRPLPFQDPDRLAAIYENSGGQFEFNSVSGGVFSQWQQRNKSFTSLAIVGYEGFNLSGQKGQFPERLNGANCSWNLLGTLGVRPELGRDFNAADDQLSANGTVLLGWNLWRRRFNADPSIVGQTIHLNTREFTVIGVLPRWFVYPDNTVQLLTPIYNDRPASFMRQFDSHAFQAVGRLKPGVSLASAQADLSLISRQIHDQYPGTPFIASAANLRPLLDHMVGEIRRPLYVVLAATGCVLLIACLNLTNLLVARAAARRRNFAIRSALGGGPVRLIRERLIESLVIATAGGALGLLLAFSAVQWFARVRTDVSRIDSVHIDWAVALFAVAVILFCGLFAGLASMPRLGNAHLLAALQDSSRGSAGTSRARLRRSLLGAEVAVTVLLLITAGLLLKTYAHLRTTSLGCDTRNVLTMHLDVFGRNYGKPAQLANFYARLLEQVRALPGVQAAGFVNAVPGQGYYGDNGFAIQEHPPLPAGKTPIAILRVADSGYFQAMHIPILSGRSFNPSEWVENAREAVISKSFADQFLPGEEPLGKHIVINDHSMMIVGVVADTRFSASEKPQPMQYFPLNLGLLNNGTLVVRTVGDPLAAALPVQRIVDRLDHDLPVSDILTMDQLLGRTMLDTTFNTVLLLGFATLSLVLSAAGLFGVLSYIVAQRRSEIGIRLALGAPRSQVLVKTMLDGLAPALFGLSLGVLAAVGASRLLRGMLYETQALDPWVYAAVSGVLVVVSAFACLLPAWRASRVDPMQALRAE